MLPDAPSQLNEEGRALWWQALFDASEDALIVCDREGHLLESNRRAAQLLEPLENHADKTIFAALAGPAVQRVKSVLERRSSSVTEQVASVSLLPYAPVRTVVDLTISRLDGDHFLVAIKDASRRWRMESHVHRLMTALDATADVFFLTDADYRITYVNAAFQSVTGHTIEETLGRSAEFLRALKDRGKVQDYINVIETGSDWVGELTNIRRDGSMYPVEATVSPIYDRTGDLLGYVSCERDISAKKRLQQELVSQRDFSQSILHSIDSAVYVLDRHFRLTQINSTWYDFPTEHGWLNLAKPPQAGVLLLDYVDNPGKRVELKLALESVLETGEPIDLYANEDGKHWLVRISPWQHGSEVVGLLYQVSDQTKINQLQAALLQAEKLKTIGSLAAGIAHDFNNLLLVIRGNTTLLLLGEPDASTARKYLQHIEQASARAADITQQLLAFSRASQDKIAVFDFNTIIDEVVQLVGGSLKSNIQMKLSPCGEACKVRMDPSRAHQVILNLCVNAQDAMPSGGTLELRNDIVTLGPHQAAKTEYPVGTPFLRCSIIDTGSGIPQDVLPRIFDPFFTTKDPGRGTGLGLSIVHGIVTQAGGFLEVNSTVGEGTEVRVFLPTVDSEITVGNEISTDFIKCSGRLLVVDDIDLVLECTCDFLRAVGFQTFSARSADEALRILAEEKIDLMLTDFNMPGISGLDLIQQARMRWPHVKCILASGYLEESIERKLTDELKAGTLRKPYNVADAAELVRKMLAPESAVADAA
jgi:two-component system, cell cycle sensor histidine kinase and response regulator CckA